MSTLPRPTLEECARRNPAVAVNRVRQFEQVVKTLQDRGVLKESRYGLQPPLGGPKSRMAASQGIKTMNRTSSAG